MGDEGRAVALAHQVFDVAGAEAGVGGDEDRPDARDREEEVDPFGGVVEPEAHLVARRDPERDEPLRRLVDPPRDLREGLARRSEDEGFAPAPSRGGPRRQLPDRGAAVPAPEVACGQAVGGAGRAIVSACHPASASFFRRGRPFTPRPAARRCAGGLRRPGQAAARRRPRPWSILPSALALPPRRRCRSKCPRGTFCYSRRPPGQSAPKPGIQEESQEEGKGEDRA